MDTLSQDQGLRADTGPLKEPVLMCGEPYLALSASQSCLFKTENADVKRRLKTRSGGVDEMKCLDYTVASVSANSLLGKPLWILFEVYSESVVLFNR